MRWTVLCGTFWQAGFVIGRDPIVSKVETSFTINLDSPGRWPPGPRRSRSRACSSFARNRAAARLLVYATESWSSEHYQQMIPALKEFGVDLIEQPFPPATNFCAIWPRVNLESGEKTSPAEKEIKQLATLALFVFKEHVALSRRFTEQ